jgi:arabinose-5-phosphate isomerase
MPQSLRHKKKSSAPFEKSDTLAFAHSVLEVEARAMLAVSSRLGADFLKCVQWLHACRGQVVVTAIGKPGFIAQKLSATLASTGTPSLYLHPAEASHGDLGRVRRGDVVLALSNSGASEELVRLLPSLKHLGAKVVALTGDPQSPLAKGADLVVDLGRIDEACPMGLVPTASSAVLHAVSDALALCVMRLRPFGTEEYARFHPGGKLGRQVMRVSEVMRAGRAHPVVKETTPLSDVVVVMTNTPGRPGAANIVNTQGLLVGIFTDGDLRRLVEKGQTNFKRPVKNVMGKRPTCIGPEALVLAATALMREKKVDQLPVVDTDGRPVGLLDVQDLLATRML